MQALLKLTNFVSKTFALWAIVFALLAFLFPAQFKIFAPYIPLPFRFSDVWYGDYLNVC